MYSIDHLITLYFNPITKPPIMPKAMPAYGAYSYCYYDCTDTFPNFTDNYSDI